MTVECEIDSLKIVYGDTGEVPLQCRRRIVDSCQLRVHHGVWERQTYID